MAVRHVALLRGINVGGKNVVPMAELRRCFEDAGFRDVTTYIQSGNVVFAADQGDNADNAGSADSADSADNAEGVRDLSEHAEAAVRDLFGFDIRVAVLSAAEMRLVVAQAPPGFGTRPEEYRYDVLFTLRSSTPTAVAEHVTTCDGVDDVALGAHALYFRRLAAQASRSRLARFVGSPAYQHVTIRNWNTTRRLAEMVGAAST